MAEAIMSEHLVSVDRQRLGVMLAATYRVDEEVDVLEQLCDVNGVSNHAWRRLMMASLARLRSTRRSCPRKSWRSGCARWGSRGAARGESRPRILDS